MKNPSQEGPDPAQTDPGLTADEGEALGILLGQFPHLDQEEVREAVLDLRASSTDPAASARDKSPPRTRTSAPGANPVREARPSERTAGLEEKSGRVRPELRLSLIRRLEAMINAGIPVHTALDFLSSESDRALRQVIEDISRKISGGTYLSRAMAAHPRVFSPLAISLVAAGETSGGLHDALGRLGDYLERSLMLRRRFVAALIYPAILLALTLIVLVIVSIVVLPREQALYASLGGDLPWLTRVVSGTLTAVFNLYTVITVEVLAALVWLTWPTVGRPYYESRLRYPLAKAVLRIPVLGPVIEKAASARLLFATASLLEAGVRFSQLAVVAPVAENAVIERRFLDFLERVKKGAGLSQALEQCGLFRPMVRQMFRLGEVQGKLPYLVRKSAEIYDDDVAHSLSVLAVMLEPMAMAFMGLVVGLIVLATSLPTIGLLEKL